MQTLLMLHASIQWKQNISISDEINGLNSHLLTDKKMAASLHHILQTTVAYR